MTDDTPLLVERLDEIRRELDSAQSKIGRLGLTPLITSFDARQSMYLAQVSIVEARRRLGVLETLELAP